MRKIIDNYKTIGVFGLAKNTGKTTTLNYMMSLYQHAKIGLTSIGLDGEDLDQINYLPKPKIHVKKGMIVATTQACLEDTKITYQLLKKVDLFTALGPVRMIEVLSDGFLVVAGPTTNKELRLLLDVMKPYVDKLFIDGAFNRMTFASLNQIDAMVLATGAAVHPSMDKTIQRTKAIVESFQLPISQTYLYIPNTKMIIHEKISVHLFKQKSYSNFIDAINQYKDVMEMMYIQGAITPRMVDVLLEKRVRNIELVIDDPTKLLISDVYYEYLKKLRINISVIYQTKLLCVTINPFRPSGDHYDENEFLDKMRKSVNIPVFNVCQMEVEHV
ncbi:MAG: hypothetical protein EP317_04750 [Bacillota bacterium]|nr:MAG: hypothetical protein EP317_04750 [Bacillota bacterium]